MSFSAYSFLDQPQVISTPEGRIELTYDALGNKLQKRVYAEGFNPDNGPLNECVAEDLMNQQDYLLDFVYRWHYPETKPNSTEAKFRGHRFYHEEGSIEWRRIDSQDDAAFVPCFQYTIRDHLGNGRVYFTKDYDGDNLLDVLQESHYYPFGAQLEGLSRLYDPPGSVPNATNGYIYTEEEDPTFIEYLQYTHDLKRYNGKEYNRELGLNWYDYGARWYDPVIGRWNAVDPLAEDYYSINSYVYVANNPMLFIDPDGMRIGRGRTHFDKFWGEVQDKINQKKDEASNLRAQAIGAAFEGDIDKAAELAAQSNEAEAAVFSYENVLSELQTLESSDQVYNINTGVTHLMANGGAASITYDKRKDEVNINLAGLYTTGKVAHELKHAFQYQIGKLSFGKGGNSGTLYDIEDEVEAYARGAMFGEAAKSKEEIMNSPLYRLIKHRKSQRVLSPYKQSFIDDNNKSYNERRGSKGKRKEKITHYYIGYKNHIIEK